MQRRCEGLNPFCSEGLVERKPSSEETRSKGPTDEVGIRHRDLGPARTVGHGPRGRAGALGSDSKRTSRVNPRKAPSPRAHGLDVYDRAPNRQGDDDGMRRPGWLALREGGKVRAAP